MLEQLYRHRRHARNVELQPGRGNSAAGPPRSGAAELHSDRHGNSRGDEQRDLLYYFPAVVLQQLHDDGVDLRNNHLGVDQWHRHGLDRR